MQDIHASLIKNLNMISSHEPNSFAKKSMAIRIPEIVKAVAKNGQDHLTLSQYESLMTLVTALQQNGKIIPLVNSTKCDDYEDWNELYLKELASKTWCNAPWFYAEAYCFRLILDLVGFFTSGIDPYKVPKTMEIESTSTWNHLSTALTASDSLGTRSKQLACLLQCCLWGNKADGCFQAGKNGLLKENSNLCEQEDLILVDDTQSVLDFLSSCQKDTTSIHFINDNSGAEMLMDLALADCLLTQKWTSNITFNVKAFPTYVSDMTVDDLQNALKHMSTLPCPYIAQLHTRLVDHIQMKRLVFTSHVFWNSGHFFWEMPKEICKVFEKVDLVIVKGDANYRRLLGDRHWPITTSVDEAIPYFPTSFVSLRTLKSDPIVGISMETYNRMLDHDAEWRVNGQYGIIQSVLNN